MKPVRSNRGRCVDTVTAARHANTEDQDTVFQLGGAAESGKRVRQVCANHFLKVQPVESQTPGLLSPSFVPLNKLLNIPELSTSLCLKKAG